MIELLRTEIGHNDVYTDYFQETKYTKEFQIGEKAHCGYCFNCDKNGNIVFDSEYATIRLGFENGLTLEQVQLYANPSFNEYQMHEICRGFINDLTLEQVKTYANSDISCEKMREIREALEAENEEEKTRIARK